MKNLRIKAFIVLVAACLLSGCGNGGTSNRDIVLRYAKEHKEEGNEAIYRQLANIIVNRNSYNPDGDININVDDNTEKVVNNTVETEETDGRYNIEQINNGNYIVDGAEADTDGVDCTYALNPGLYIASRDFPSGSYRIGFKTTNHKMYCKRLGGDQIHLGNMVEKDGIYWYTVEFTDDALVKIETKAYLKLYGVGNSLTADMSDEVYTDIKQTDLAWLAITNKHPKVQFENAKFVKKLANNTFVVKNSNGMFCIELENPEGYDKNKEIKFTGDVESAVVVGQVQMAKIKVPSKMWSQEEKENDIE